MPNIGASLRIGRGSIVIGGFAVWVVERLAGSSAVLFTKGGSVRVNVELPTMYRGAADTFFPFQFGNSTSRVKVKKLKMRLRPENCPVSSIFIVRVLGHHDTVLMSVPLTAPGVDPPIWSILHLSSSGNFVPRTTILGLKGECGMHFSRMPFRM